jgi:hypothetical protein
MSAIVCPIITKDVIAQNILPHTPRSKFFEIKPPYPSRVTVIADSTGVFLNNLPIIDPKNR